ncbi:MAG: CoB--CoM heterodisulfide reductase iron-sulfur subunit B family protein [Syntrophobacteraceae bacterium]
MKIPNGKKIAMFRCCMTSVGLKQYECSANAVLRELGIEFSDIKEFNCCGYPLRNLSFKAYLIASSRNLALAEKEETDILTFCNCCYGSIKHAEHILNENEQARDEINAALGKEGLHVEGTTRTRHFLEFLNTEIGVEGIKSRIKRPFSGLKVAVHYGCHILRPKKVVGFGETFPPLRFDALVEATGATSITWTGKEECCGSPLLGINDELSMDLTEKKLLKAARGGAEMMCVTCPYCQIQLDRVQKTINADRKNVPSIPSLLYPQLLGLAMGLSPEVLGIDLNAIRSNAEHYLRVVSQA